MYLVIEIERVYVSAFVEEILHQENIIPRHSPFFDHLAILPLVIVGDRAGIVTTCVAKAAEGLDFAFEFTKFKRTLETL